MLGTRSMGHFVYRALYSLWTLCLCLRAAAGGSNQPPFLKQSFYFDWDPPGTGTPIHITGQCDTLHITWERGTATGPNPTAPYYLQIYTSTFIVPFVVAAGMGTSMDFAVPFVPETQFQMCMFDKNGNTGGCQGIYTVIPSNNTSCANVTFPAGALDVEGQVDSGPLSQYGWIDQCTDISVTPKNGTPPYRFTVAPALHPPLNISSTTMDAINWTVSLSWGFPFFISVVDAQGNKWSQGPLHSGENGPTGCLDLDGSADKGVPVGAAIGSGLGGLALGALLGLLAMYVYNRQRMRRQWTSTRRRSSPPPIFTTPYDPPLNSAGMASDPFGHQARDASSSSRNTGADPYHIEPFTMSSSDSAARTSLMDSASSSQLIQPGTPQTPSGAVTSPPHEQPPALNLDPSQVYVVHHDGGRPPVTVYTANGTEVVELPPRYGENQGPPPLQQPRQPGAAPRKGRRVASFGQSPSTST
ncbi:hypothetical protein DENSPDRAFT_833752 [Dentipellis sp. KUC8613]|nr:hypothetical protein DENSPDRAFT_833752 [Dentipellis sp. KUC8613]